MLYYSTVSVWKANSCWWCRLPEPCRSWALCPKHSGRARSSEPTQVPASTCPCQLPPRWEPGRLGCGTVLLRNDSSKPLWGEEEERKEEAQDVGFVLLQLYLLAHTQESQLVLMGIFRGLSWKPWDSDSSVAWGIRGVPKLIICLPCLEGSCQNKNLLTTISTETLALYGAF